MRGLAALLGLALLAVAALALEGALALAGVEPRAAREDPYLGFEGGAPLFVPERAADGTAWLRTAPAKLRFFNEQRFAARKPPDGRRVFCLGGSTTYGHPYRHPTSFCGWLGALLRAADPEHAWEAVNAGGISYASYRVARVMDELAGHEPDVFVVLTGHNEFLERRTYAALLDLPPAVRRLDAALSRTRSYTEMRRLVDGALGRTPAAGAMAGEVEAILDGSVGPDAYRRDDEQRRRIVEHFRFNLERMARTARRTGAELVFVRPASNLRDCAPFRSEPSAGARAEARSAFAAAVARGRAELAAGRPGEAAAALDEAVALDPRRADAHYERGRALFAAGRVADAADAFARARDEDVCPLRAPGEIEDAVAEVAARTGAALVDFGALARALSTEVTGQPIPGAEVFLDHVHPVVEGHRRLALAILDVLVARGRVRPGRAWGPAAIAAVTREVESRVDGREQARSLRTLAKTLAWAGRAEEAARLARQALAGLPGDAESLFIAATWDAERGALDAAVAGYRAALASDPGYAKAWNNLGIALSRLGRRDEALAAWRTALEHAPGTASARFNLADALCRAGRAEEGTAHALELLHARPDDADAHALAADCYRARGLAEPAARHADTAARLRGR